MSQSPHQGGTPTTRTWHQEIDDVLVHENRYYVPAASAPGDGRRHVLKHGEIFGVFDRFGDVRPIGPGEEGLYYEGTRFVSTLLLRFGALRPLFLSSTVDQNLVLITDLMNPDLVDEEGATISKGTIHVLRRRFLWEHCCYERCLLRNFGSERVRLPLVLYFDADFVDIFEVRGHQRPKRGERLETEVGSDRVVLGYRGIDEAIRRTRIDFAPAPDDTGESHAEYEIELDPGDERELVITIECDAPSADRGGCVAVVEAYASASRELVAERQATCRIESSNEEFDAWIDRSCADLHMLVSQTENGPYPFAGVPWFSTEFGRDGIWTALEALWFWPGLARGVLRYLAAHQAEELDPDQDAEPGKILHETRKGELAALGEIPFGLYYGSVDSTPLFVLLYGEHYHRTGDLDFARELWPAVVRALDWIDRFGDSDGDGFVDYLRKTPQGLVQQGWKDSDDSVFHADGRIPEGPIALCEVQAYVFAARRRAAEVAMALGLEQEATRQLVEAERLRQRFEEVFWVEKLGTYAIALDGQGRPCEIRTSNPAHCLYAAFVADERAARLAGSLLTQDAFSGWGIRTVAAGEARFNPMSYHDGSVWPHDNAIAARGLARYGFKRAAMRVFHAMFDVSRYVDHHRLPELICGFSRREGSGPTLYPVACSPQAWAAAAPFLMLEACLGMIIDAPRRELRIQRAVLPEFLDTLRISELRIGDAAVDLELRRHPEAVSVNILRRDGALDIVSVK